MCGIDASRTFSDAIFNAGNRIAGKQVRTSRVYIIHTVCISIFMSINVNNACAAKDHHARHAQRLGGHYAREFMTAVRQRHRIELNQYMHMIVGACVCLCLRRTVSSWVGNCLRFEFIYAENKMIISINSNEVQTTQCHHGWLLPLLLRYKVM